MSSNDAVIPLTRHSPHITYEDQFGFKMPICQSNPIRLIRARYSTQQQSEFPFQHLHLVSPYHHVPVKHQAVKARAGSTKPAELLSIASRTCSVTICAAIRGSRLLQEIKITTAMEDIARDGIGVMKTLSKHVALIDRYIEEMRLLERGD